MSATQDLEQRIADHYAAEAPPQAPDWVLDRILASVDTIPQRRAVLGRAWRIPTMPSTLVKVGVAVVAVAVIGVIAVTQPRPSVVGPAASPSPVSPSPSTSPSSVGPAADLGIFAPISGRILSGVWGVDPMAVDPSEPARSAPLRMGPDRVMALGWSRDGTELLFMRRDPPDGTFRHLTNLFVLHADGSETQLTSTATDMSGAAIAPDGSRVIFGVVNDGLFVVDAHGGEPQRISDGGESPSFSPDGTRIAYLSEGPDEQVWVASADGTDSHRILADEPGVADGVSELVWSPAGDRIAIANTLEGRAAIYTFAPDGSDFTKVITGGMNPFWSPDGSQIAYLRPYDGPVPGLAIADADGSNVREFGVGASGPWHPGTPIDDTPPTQVETPTPVETLTPVETPTPDGTAAPARTSITRLGGEVLRFTGEQSRGDGDLIAVHPETGEVRVLLEGLDVINSARWSEDGQWLAYDSGANAVRLWIVGSEQPPRQPLADVAGWTWSPDGARLAVVDEGGLSIFDASTGQMTEFGASQDTPVWSPDGTKLVFGVRGGSIYSVDVRTSERSLLVRLPGEDLDSVDRIEWSPDGSRLAIYNDLEPGLGRLFVLNADGSDIRVLAEDTHVSGLDWSPDGTRIAFTETSDPELRIWVAHGDGSSASLIGSQPNQDDGGDPVWSPDGSQIAFWTEPDEALVIDADGSGGVASLDALTYENWRGGWFACRPCAGFTSGNF